MKLAIIGSRNASDYELLKRWMESIGSDGYGVLDITEVISGGAQGADSLGARWALEHGIKLTLHLPDWDLYGKRAGFIRNELIIKDADMVLALWDSVSRGTAHSLSIAKRLKKPTLIIYI